MIDLHDFGLLFRNRLISVSFELEQVELRRFISVIPFLEKSQSEFQSKICTSFALLTHNPQANKCPPSRT